MPDEPISVVVRAWPEGDGRTLRRSLRNLIDDGDLPTDLAAQAEAALETEGDVAAFSRHLLAERVALVVLAVGHAGACDDRQERQGIIVAVPLRSVRCLRLVLFASTYAAAAGGVILLAEARSDTVPELGRLAVEASVLLLLTFGISGIVDSLAPAGLASTITGLVLLLTLGGERLLPPRLRLLVPLSRMGGQGIAWLWVLGAVLAVAAALVWTGDQRATPGQARS